MTPDPDTPRSRNNLWLGVIAVVLALALMFWLVPMDTETGLIERVRRRYVIGDALAPSIAAGFILLGGAMLVIFERNAPEQPAVSAPVLRFLAGLLSIVAIGFLIMRFAGPLAVEIAGAGEYRLLRDTTPWKHIGFLVGGAGMVAGLICLIERRLSLRALFVGLGVALALIAVFDLPFDDLLIPPNGDV